MKSDQSETFISEQESSSNYPVRLHEVCQSLCLSIIVHGNDNMYYGTIKVTTTHKIPWYSHEQNGTNSLNFIIVIIVVISTCSV